MEKEKKEGGKEENQEKEESDKAFQLDGSPHEKLRTSKALKEEVPSVIVQAFEILDLFSHLRLWPG